MGTKYDWSSVPAEVNWIATDGYSGIPWGYENKPRRIDECFVEMNRDEWPVSVHQIVTPYKGDWKDSLEQRPVEKN